MQIQFLIFAIKIVAWFTIINSASAQADSNPTTKFQSLNYTALAHRLIL